MWTDGEWPHIFFPSFWIKFSIIGLNKIKDSIKHNCHFFLALNPITIFSSLCLSPFHMQQRSCKYWQRHRRHPLLTFFSLKQPALCVPGTWGSSKHWGRGAEADRKPICIWALFYDPAHLTHCWHIMLVHLTVLRLNNYRQSCLGAWGNIKCFCFCLTVELERRIDFELREGLVESRYWSAVTSHTGYWCSHDIALFLLTFIYKETMPPSDAAEDTSEPDWARHFHTLIKWLRDYINLLISFSCTWTNILCLFFPTTPTDPALLTLGNH